MALLTLNNPIIGGDEDAWGAKLNANFDTIASFIGSLDSAELAVLNGITASTSELNLLDGVTATTAELNILDGVTATAADINHTSGATGNLQSQIDLLSQLVPAGAVMPFAMDTAPTGWLKANGALVSRTTYSALFAAIGTKFGSNFDGTQFRLPDLRGEFVRGWDDGRGVDASRSFGSSQLDQMQRIRGSFRIHGDASTPVSGAFSIARNVNTDTWGGGTGDTDQVTFDSALSDNARVSSTTSGETRARNVALLYCIKV